MKINWRIFSKPKKNCTTCRFNDGVFCNVGTHYAEMGKTGLCIQGELWEKKVKK